MNNLLAQRARRRRCAVKSVLVLTLVGSVVVVPAYLHFSLAEADLLRSTGRFSAKKSRLQHGGHTDCASPNMSVTPWDAVQQCGTPLQCDDGANVSARFYKPHTHNRSLLRALMRRLRPGCGAPFAWIRWADGDMYKAQSDREVRDSHSDARALPLASIDPS